jgi:uncharacterized protein involved in exopolysaccharide biosynthesis
MTQQGLPDDRSGAFEASSKDRPILVLRTEDLDGAATRLDLGRLWDVVWRRRRLVVGLTLASFTLALAYVMLATPWYRAEVLMIPVSQREGGGLGGQLGQLGGLAGIAGLAGIKLGTDSSVTPVAVLKSRELAREFIEKNQLLPALLSNGWGVGWLESLRSDDEPLDMREGVEILSTKVTKIVEDNKKGLVTLAVEWTDPNLAAEWANLMAAQANEKLRQRAMAESTRNIDYLRGRLASENVVSIQQALGRLIESEMQNLMLAQGRQDYAFQVIDKAEVPRKSARPARLKILALSVLLGLAFSTLLVLTQEALRQRKNGYA